MRTLHPARCTLDPLLPAHAEAMLAVLSDPAIYAFENAPPGSVDALRQRAQRLAAGRTPDGGAQWLNRVLHGQASGGPMEAAC